MWLLLMVADPAAMFASPLFPLTLSPTSSCSDLMCSICTKISSRFDSATVAES